MQVKNACTATEISTYDAACLESTSTQATCDAWFTNDAGSAGCQACLIGPTTTVGDAQAPTGQGGVWYWNNLNLGPNLPGCLSLENASACGSAYAQVDECFVAAGCGDCTMSTVQGCETTIFGTGGACASYYGPYMTGCPQADFSDGGVGGPGGPCGSNTSILNIICGTGM